MKKVIIELDLEDINKSVPVIYIDGKKVVAGIQSVSLRWNTDTDTPSDKSFTLDTLQFNGTTTSISVDNMILSNPDLYDHLRDI